MPKRTDLNEQQIQDIKSLFDDNCGSRRIAKKLGLTRSIVKRVLKNLGLDGSQRGTPKRPFLDAEKKCARCKIIKPISEFELRNHGHEGLHYRYCIPCEKEFVAEKSAKYKLNKAKNNPGWKLNRNITDLIGLSLRANSNDIRIECILPYTLEELKQHLEAQFESWMSWENWGKYIKASWNDDDQSTWTWHIDHIIPKSIFKFASINDPSFIQCWSLNNLRPYSAKQNVIDGATRVRHKAA